nr:unnamed protein product [Digitaria exilis]
MPISALTGRSRRARACRARRRQPPAAVRPRLSRPMAPLHVPARGARFWQALTPALAVASPPRTTGFCRRRRCPSRRYFLPRAVFSPRPRAPAACSTPARRADAAHGANTAATSRCRRDSSPSCPSLYPVLPEHPLPPLSLLLKPPNSSPLFHAGKRSPEQAEAPPSSFPWGSTLHCSSGQTEALTSFPILHCHSSTNPRPLSPTTAAGVARRRSPSSSPPPAHVHSPLHSSSGRTEGTNSFPVPRWCSPTSSPTLSDPDAAAATTVVDLDSGHPRPRDLAQKNRGEPLSVSPYFPGPVSPPFGRRNHAGELEGLNSGLADGVYELVPAAEEIAQESEVNVVHVDPSPEQEYRFEPEGKPRSIT